jgi:hypothetical protein
MRYLRLILKLLVATPVVAAPFVFPNFSPILVPFGVVALIVLALIGPKSERKWKFKTHSKRRKILDDPSPDITDLDPTNPFGMYDDYYL